MVPPGSSKDHHGARATDTRTSGNVLLYREGIGRLVVFPFQGNTE
jgi:hypothetical protein